MYPSRRFFCCYRLYVSCYIGPKRPWQHRYCFLQKTLSCPRRNIRHSRAHRLLKKSASRGNNGKTKERKKYITRRALPPLLLRLEAGLGRPPPPWRQRDHVPDLRAPQKGQHGLRGSFAPKRLTDRRGMSVSNHTPCLYISFHILLICGAQALAIRWNLGCRSPLLHHPHPLLATLPISSHRYEPVAACPEKSC